MCLQYDILDICSLVEVDSNRAIIYLYIYQNQSLDIHSLFPVLYGHATKPGNLSPQHLLFLAL